MKKIIYACLVWLSAASTKADEGMWLPHLISGQTYDEMVRLGLKLTPEQIFSVNNSSLKDAVVRLGGGFCTGEIVSAEGLMLTNHHCGFDAIQNLSSADEKDGGKKNYLQNGFWAKLKSDELPAGFGVSFLMKVEDVTDEVLKGLSEDMTLVARNAKIAEVIKTIQKRFEDKDAFISG